MRFEKEYGYQTYREGVITEVPTQKIYPKSTISRRCWFQILWRLGGTSSKYTFNPAIDGDSSSVASFKASSGKERY